MKDALIRHTDLIEGEEVAVASGPVIHDTLIRAIAEGSNRLP